MALAELKEKVSPFVGGRFSLENTKTGYKVEGRIGKIVSSETDIMVNLSRASVTVNGVERDPTKGELEQPIYEDDRPVFREEAGKVVVSCFNGAIKMQFMKAS